MHILILTQFFHPEPGPRVHELAWELAARGHTISVITGFPTVPFATFYDGYRPSLYRRDRYDNVEVIRVPHFPHGQKSAIRRLLHYGSFALSSSIIGNALAGTADCMYVFLPPPLLGFTARFISVFRDIPFMYDIQDIWPDAIVGSGIRLPVFPSRMLELLSVAALHLPERISVPSHGYKRNLVAKGVDPCKIEVIPNWADEASNQPIEYDIAFAQQYGMSRKFNITFAGNLGLAQALDSVIDCAAILRHIADIQFVFAGDGLALDGLRAKATELGLQNVRFLGRLPQDLMPSLFSASDALLVHLRQSPIFRITIPSKTQAYMASGKPIVMAVEGDGADLIKSTCSGVTCSQEAPLALADCIRKLYEMDPAERIAMGRNARQIYLERFTRSTVVSQFESLLRKIARNGA
jgi:glycosyltransferase involved in cell wall biosynthesis